MWSSAGELFASQFEQADDIGAKRAPDLDMKQLRAFAPKHDLAFGEYGARTHADRKGRGMKIEGAPHGEHRFGVVLPACGISARLGTATKGGSLSPTLDRIEDRLQLCIERRSDPPRDLN